MAQSAKKSQVQKKFDIFRFVLTSFLLIGLLSAIMIGACLLIQSRNASIVKANLPEHIPMDLIAFGDNRRLSNMDHVSHPHVTIFGKVSDYQNARDSRPGFDILVDGTSVSITARSGEFAQPMTLQTGKNTIDISVKWSDRVHERFAYDLTYQSATGIAP